MRVAVQRDPLPRQVYIGETLPKKAVGRWPSRCCGSGYWAPERAPDRTRIGPVRHQYLICRAGRGGQLLDFLRPSPRNCVLAALAAYADLLDLRVEFFPYQPCAARVWELRENVTCHGGWHVAVAELLDAQLATLDGRLANSPGPRCQFLLPPSADGIRQQSVEQ